MIITTILAVCVSNTYTKPSTTFSNVLPTITHYLIFNYVHSSRNSNLPPYYLMQSLTVSLHDSPPILPTLLIHYNTFTTTSTRKHNSHLQTTVKNCMVKFYARRLYQMMQTLLQPIHTTKLKKLTHELKSFMFFLSTL